MSNADTTSQIKLPLTSEDFLALGEENNIVYRREISGKQLKAMFPEAEDAPEKIQFQAVFSADGTPLLIADETDAVTDWLDETGHNMTLRH